MIVGVPVVALNPIPKINPAVDVVNPDTVPVNTPAAPVATPKPVAAAAACLGQMDQKNAVVLVKTTSMSMKTVSTAAVCVPMDWVTSMASLIVPAVPM